ncbi:MAG: DinB family protein [Candidatus Thorarchaeota archaeon]
MSEQIRTSLKQAMIAFHIHAHPEKVLKGISVEIALKKVGENTHTIWDLIHHLTFWQDLTLDAIDDKEVDWSRSKTENWPSTEKKIDQGVLDGTIQRFLEGVGEFSKRAETVDLDSNMPAWPQGTKIWALQMIAQHNSYHLGQIVTLRQLLNSWPKE